MRFIIIIAFLLMSNASNGMDNKIKYPERALELNFSGFVDIIYDIDNSGMVENVRIIKSEPKYVFDRSVDSQVKKWRFMKGGAKKDVPLKIVFKCENN